MAKSIEIIEPVAVVARASKLTSVFVHELRTIKSKHHLVTANYSTHNIFGVFHRLSLVSLKNLGVPIHTLFMNGEKPLNVAMVELQTSII